MGFDRAVRRSAVVLFALCVLSATLFVSAQQPRLDRVAWERLSAGWRQLREPASLHAHADQQVQHRAARRRLDGARGRWAHRQLDAIDAGGGRRHHVHHHGAHSGPRCTDRRAHLAVSQGRAGPRWWLVGWSGQPLHPRRRRRGGQGVLGRVWHEVDGAGSENRRARLGDAAAAPRADRSFANAPAIYYDGLVYMGVAGGEMGVRGQFGAYDAKTGKEVWKFYTVPALVSSATRRGRATRG